MNKPKCLVHGHKKFYRTAGYRFPVVGDIYIGKSGKISVSDGKPTDGQRLILREYNPQLDFKDFTGIGVS